MMAGLTDLLRRRRRPPVKDTGLFGIGSEAFRRTAAFFEDGTLHVVPEESMAVFAELDELRHVWDLPRVRIRRAASPVDIAILHGKVGHGQRRTGSVDDLEPGARRILHVLNEAAALNASDVKLHMRQDHADLRVKLAGVEDTHGDPWPLREATQAISWLYDERAKGDGSAAQQTGSLQSFAITPGDHVPLPDGVARLRGQKGFLDDELDTLVLRLLYRREGHEAGRLEDLGFDDEALDVLAEERRSDNGLMIIGGSTGDGKSTTLVRQLERLYQERGGRVSISTFEDPVEYPIEGQGIAQMVVRSAARGEARTAEYTEALRAFVRTNPDIGMVSEIRTLDDARTILQFVSSGHKLFTTIHSASASNALFRVISLGVDPRELSQPGMVSLVMRQKLVPVLCPDCARPATPAETAHIARWTGLPSGASHGRPDGPGPRVRNREGCGTCLANRAGDLGRAAWGGVMRMRAVAEYIRVDDRFRGFVENNDSRCAHAYWTTPETDGGMGGITVDTRIAALVAAGEVDYVDVSNDGPGLERAQAHGEAHGAETQEPQPQESRSQGTRSQVSQAPMPRTQDTPVAFVRGALA